MKLPSDSRRRNALVLGLRSAIEATFDASDWKQVGYLTDTRDWIARHPRLIRSLHWGDPDYTEHVLDSVEKILSRDPANLQVLVEYAGIREWLETNEPGLHAELLGLKLAAHKSLDSAVKASEDFDIGDYIRRINEALDRDPALAIGSTKELLEAVLKKVLGLEGALIGDDDMPKLLKSAQAALGVDPKDVDSSAPGAESFRRRLGSLAQIVVSVVELRNLYGTGHGKTNAPGLDNSSARLVVSAGTAAATFIMERYHNLREE